MKKNIFIPAIFKALLLVASLSLLLSSCKKEDNKTSGPPVVTKIRAITPAPNDSTLTKVGPGQLVVVQGSNLKSVTAIYFNGVKGSFNPALVADNNVVVTIPNIDFSKPQGDLDNTIRVVTTSGETTFKLPVQPPPPIVSSLSSEYAAPGSKITMFGQYLYLVSKISFNGGDATDIVPTSNGLSLTLTIPPSATTGNVVVTAKGGTTTYVSYNDKTTGMACNFDNVMTYQYFSGNLTNSATLFPGNTGNYVQLSTAGMTANNNNWFDGGRSINLNTVQWVPEANLADPVSSWALKFEVFVKAPWKSGSILIRRNETGSWGFIARYEPWKTAPNNTYQTTGWVTVVIPLTEFKLPSGVNGTGASAGNMVTLLNTMGPSLTPVADTKGKRGMSIMLVNDVPTPSAAVDLAIDNIRFIKIK